MKRKRDKIILILSLIIGLLMCYFNTKEIWSNQSIDWVEKAPFLWLGLGILIILLNLVLYFKTELYFFISLSFWICLLANVFYEAANKPICFERELKYGYKANFNLPKDGNTYQVYLKKLEKVMQNDGIEEIDNEEEMAKKFQTYNDLFPNTTKSDFAAKANKEALNEFITNTIINNHFYILNSGGVYNLEKLLKQAKFVNKIPTMLFKNCKFYRYKLLTVTPQMINDSAGIVMVNLGEVSFE